MPPAAKKQRKWTSEPSRRSERLRKPGDRPVDVPKRIRMTLLCLNRSLQEPGLTRLVKEYYDGLLMDDVVERATVVLDELWAAADQPTVRNEAVPSLIDEIIGDVHYYADNAEFMYFAMSTISVGMMDRSCHDSIVQAFATRLFDVFLHSTQKYMHKLGAYFVYFVEVCLRGSRFDSVRQDGFELHEELLQHILDSGAVNLLQQMTHEHLYGLSFKQNKREAGTLLIMARGNLIKVADECAVHPRRNISIPQLQARIDSMYAEIEALRRRDFNAEVDDDLDDDDDDDDSELSDEEDDE
ncbi:hypothetical protein MPSEU_000846100 [Mayamaea pseudoterrestris]|nr:hypothetical protein MPSEU_000846100 [Mayamaea pseudoterrestris]